MTGRFYQCCYTNASRVADGKLSSGWQAVCVSPDIPPDAFNACVALLNANSTIRSSMTDERGNVLNQLQIFCDGSYLYLARTQYGLLDRVGRANMFAHAFIFSLRERAVLTDPNHFLTVERSNFADNEESATHIPETLVRTAPWDLESALCADGLDAERFLLLVRCVYLQMSERKAPKPLYIQYDGTDTGLGALLYCIWSGIPLSLRARLSAATASGGDDAGAGNLIFSEFAGRHDYYVNPFTGESSVLTPRAQRRVERLGFVDFAPLNYTTQDIANYFTALEETAVALGDPGAGNELVLKIAYQQLCEEPVEQLGDAALDGRLSDALRTRYSGSERMELYVAALLGEVYRRRLFLTDECEASLADWLGHAVSDDLAKAGEQYNIYRFSTLSVPEAVEKLEGMPPSAFSVFSRKLLGEAAGAEILDHYFSTAGIKHRDNTWEALQALWEESAFLGDRPQTAHAVSTYAWELYCAQLAQSGKAVSAHGRYTALMELLSPVECEIYSQKAKNHYWQETPFEQLTPDDIDEYQYFSVSGNDKCMQFCTFLKLAGLLKEEGERAFLLGLNEFARRYKGQIGEQPLQTAAGRLLQSLYIPSGDAGEWVLIAVLLSSAELLTALLDVRRTVQQGCFGHFLEQYRAARDIAAECDLQAEFQRAAQTVAESCLQQDTTESPVPLDVWLAIGAAAGANPFSILDNASPAILRQEESGSVVAGSELLQDRRFIDFGEMYIQTKAEHAKTVRRWLGEWRQAERRRQADERKNMKPESSSLGSLLGKGLSLFGRGGRSDTKALEQDEDAPGSASSQLSNEPDSGGEA